MFYKKLYENYVNEMEVLKKYIKHLKSDFERSEDINYRVSMLYAMYLDMKHTAEYLKRKCEVMKNEK